MAKWNINLNNLGTGGFAPEFYLDTYPSYGNANQAGAMTCCDLTSPNSIKQGPGMAAYANGTQAAAVTTLIRGIQSSGAANSIHYAVGGAKLYQINSLTKTVTNAGAWPHTIDNDGAGGVSGEDGEDVCLYQGNLYYSYNHSGSEGDIGKYDLSSTFDDDWCSTVPSGGNELVGDVPHQMIVGGNDTMYIANGRYVASWDGTTFVTQALDLPTGATIQSIAWANDRLYIAAVTNNYTSFQIKSSIYVWDGTTAQWESEIKVNGNIGRLFVKDAVVYVIYRDGVNSQRQVVAYVSGLSTKQLAVYNDTSASGHPSYYYQVTEIGGFLVMAFGGKLYYYGSGTSGTPPRLFSNSQLTYSTMGGISLVGALGLFASNTGGSYIAEYYNGYYSASLWKSLNFDITHLGRVSKIDFVRINTEIMATGARVDWRLLDNEGTVIYSDVISYAKYGTKTSFYFPLNGKVANNFRLEFDWQNGSTSNPVKIKSARVYGSAD